jgi:hypothetical protein
MQLKEMWRYFVVVLNIRNRVIGGVPKDPKLIEAWMKTNMPEVADAEIEKLKTKTIEEIPAVTDEAAQAMWTTFYEDSVGVHAQARHIKALFKESANILRVMLESEDKAGKRADAKEAEAKAKAEGKEAPKATGLDKTKFTNLKAKLVERLFVVEQRIYFYRDNKPVKKPDSFWEHPIHVMTPQGPRTALKRSDYVGAPAEMRFHLKVLNDKFIDEDLIKVILKHAEENGFWTDRSQGQGLFRTKSVTEVSGKEIEKLEDEIDEREVAEMKKAEQWAASLEAKKTA